MGGHGYKLDRVFFRKFTGLLQILFPTFTSLTTAINIFLLSILLIEQYVIYNVGLIPSAFYKVLSDRSEDEFIGTLWRSFIILTAISLVRSFKQYTSSVLYVTWRQLLCRATHVLYFSDVTYYQLNVLVKNIDNPDQRMTQDIDKFCQLLSDVSAHIIIAPFTIGYYSYQAYCNAGWIGPTGCFIYFLISTFINRLFMSPIVSLVVEQEKREGNFRYFNHLQVRTNAEPFAFTQSTFYEHCKTNTYLDALIETQQTIFNKRLLLNIATNFFDYSGSILSYIMLSIPIFAGKYFDLSASQLSALISQNAFVCMYLISSFSSIVDQSSKFADMAGVTHRISELLETLANLNSSCKDGKFPSASKMCCSESSDVFLEVRNLSIKAPGSDTTLVKGLSFKAKLGENILITGPSSSGKTSILRQLCGLWPTDHGDIQFNIPLKIRQIMFFHQKPYFTHGSLKDQLVFPLSACEKEEDIATDKLLLSYLKMLSLDGLIERLGGLNTPILENWHDVLSPGEMQRLCFIRLFYHQPQIAFLDEMTSAVSPDIEELLYSKCRSFGITCISVGHRASLQNYHEKVLLLDGAGNWIFQSTSKE